MPETALPQHRKETSKMETNDSKPHGIVPCSAWLGVGELVITRIKNRWGLECAGTVEARHGKTADVRVWNMNGPGADMLVTGIPIDELTKDGETPND